MDWISIRGAWGKSFNAPSLADDENAAIVEFFNLTGSLAASLFDPPASLTGPGQPYPVYTGGPFLAVRGNKPGIQPQKATTWSIGGDIQPPFVPGLTLGVTYYNIDYKGYIGLPPFQNANALYQNYGSVITINNGPGDAAFAAAVQEAFDAASACSSLTGPIPCALPNLDGYYAFFDGRKQNVGDVKVSGLDFAVNYRRETGFGAVFLNANGTYNLTSDLRAGSSTTYSSQLPSDGGRWQSRTTVGADIGNLTAQVSWSYLEGSTLDFPVGYTNPAEGFFQQTQIDSYHLFDLFFRYEFDSELGWDKDLAMTLNVKNVFDQDPPRSIGGDNINGRLGYANGATLGRLFQFGVSKKF